MNRPRAQKPRSFRKARATHDGVATRRYREPGDLPDERCESTSAQRMLIASSTEVVITHSAVSTTTGFSLRSPRHGRSSLMLGSFPDVRRRLCAFTSVLHDTAHDVRHANGFPATKRAIALSSNIFWQRSRGRGYLLVRSRQWCCTRRSFRSFSKPRKYEGGEPAAHDQQRLCLQLGLSIDRKA